MIDKAALDELLETTGGDPSFLAELIDHGLIDALVPRKEMKQRLVEYLDYLTAREPRRAAA